MIALQSAVMYVCYDLISMIGNGYSDIMILVIIVIIIVVLTVIVIIIGIYIYIFICLFIEEYTDRSKV